MSTTTTAISASPGLDWHGPGARSRRRRLSWHTLVWALVFPPRRHRIAPTIPGLFLMALAMGIGTAAYNTGSNILFITLSLLLACLLLSGLLSWFNFSGVSWRLRAPGPWRAGHDALVAVEVRNGKKWLPTYGLWFELLTQPRLLPGGEKPDHQMKAREILAAIAKIVTRGRVFLRERLEAGGEVAVEWGVRPRQRGEAVVELGAVGSLFPFGFLRKNIGTGLRRTVLVWPAQVEYQWRGAGVALGNAQGRRTVRPGAGEDLLALRPYERGDSHRLIHWKASARLRKLMLRQFAARSQDGFTLRLCTPAGAWPRPEQFELLCSFAASLAEDLFSAGRLRGVLVNSSPPMEIRRLRDLEEFLNVLACLQPVGSGEDAAAGSPSAAKNMINLTPDGTRGVYAYVDGQSIASA